VFVCKDIGAGEGGAVCVGRVCVSGVYVLCECVCVSVLRARALL
jgi:hypothetical protein